MYILEFAKLNNQNIISRIFNLLDNIFNINERNSEDYLEIFRTKLITISE